VKLTVPGPDGHDVLAGLRSAGAALELQALLCEQPHASTASLATSGEVRQIESATVRRLARSDVTVGLWIQRHLAADASEYVKRLSVLASAGRERLGHFLLHVMRCTALQRLADGGVRLAVPLSVADLSAGAGLSREQVLRVLRALELSGDIQRDRGWVVFPPASQFLRLHRARQMQGRGI
jgi:CRP-like cAMP-binding protein